MIITHGIGVEAFIWDITGYILHSMQVGPGHIIHGVSDTMDGKIPILVGEAMPMVLTWDTGMVITIVTGMETGTIITIAMTTIRTSMAVGIQWAVQEALFKIQGTYPLPNDMRTE